MRISQLQVKAVLGIKDVTINCGRITEIVGDNGEGKTSLVEAFKASLGGGNLANLQNVNTDEKPQTVLVLDEGALKVTRRGKDTAAEERVGSSAAYKEVKKPQTVLDELFDTELSNPLELLKANPNRQVDLILEAMSPDLDIVKLRAALGDDIWPAVAPIIQAGGHPLNLMNAVHDALYASRTGVNGAKDDKARTVQELRLNIPAHLEEETQNNLAELEQKRDGMAHDLAQVQAEADTKHRETVATAEAAHAKVEGDIKASFTVARWKLEHARDEAVRVLQFEAEQKIQAIRDGLSEATLKADRDTAAKVDALRAKDEARLDEADEMLAGIREKAEAARRECLSRLEKDSAQLQGITERVAKRRSDAERLIEVRKHKELADRLESEAETLRGKSERLTTALKALDVFKAELLNSIPIDGFEVKGKEIRINNVPWKTLNTAQQIAVAVKVAALRAQKRRLKVLFIDGAEALSKKSYEILLGEIEASGCQAIVSRVTDGPLKVTARESAAATA